MTRSAPTIGILLGSARPTGNGVGILSWIKSVVTPLLPPSTTLTTLDATKLGLITGDPPFQIVDRVYDNPTTQDWSDQVHACDGFIFVTPQHNFGYPAYIKNAIDHIYLEWAGKPALVVGYSARGDDNGIKQLRAVLESEGTLEMKIGRFLGEIKLPLEFWDGRKEMKRLEEGGKIGGVEAEWLTARRADVEESAKEFIEAVQERLVKK